MARTYRPRGFRGEKRPADVIGNVVKARGRTQMRRFTRLTNAFSKKFENHMDMVALYTVWYNFVKMHKTAADDGCNGGWRIGLPLVDG